MVGVLLLVVNVVLVGRVVLWLITGLGVVSRAIKKPKINIWIRNKLHTTHFYKSTSPPSPVSSRTCKDPRPVGSAHRPPWCESQSSWWCSQRNIRTCQLQRRYVACRCTTCRTPSNVPNIYTPCPRKFRLKDSGKLDSTSVPAPDSPTTFCRRACCCLVADLSTPPQWGTCRAKSGAGRPIFLALSKPRPWSSRRHTRCTRRRYCWSSFLFGIRVCSRSYWRSSCSCSSPRCYVNIFN